MGALIRTTVYVTLFVWLILILLEGLGVTSPPSWGIIQLAGGLIGVAGVGLYLWCALTFAVIGRGTPVPLDPPRRLVVAGPYRFVRNPMAIGAGLALGGLAAFYESGALLALVGVLMLAIHAFVILYEEPTLRRSFGADYSAYCAKVNRWLPLLPIPNRRTDPE